MVSDGVLMRVMGQNGLHKGYISVAYGLLILDIGALGASGWISWEPRASSCILLVIYGRRF